jgi:RHS repeat-associated protein
MQSHLAYEWQYDYGRGQYYLIDCMGNAPGIVDYSITGGACYSLTPSVTSVGGGSKSGSANACGSVVRVDELSVGEEVPLVGTPFKLVYSSERVIGRIASYKLHTEIGTPLYGIASVKLDYTYQGTRTATYTLYTTSTSHDFFWDGQDASSNYVEGPTEVSVVETFDDGSATSTFNPSYSYYLGTWNVKLVGLGGWNLDIHHFYDGFGKLYLGDGRVRNVTAGNVSGGGHYVLSEDGSEIYYFDSNGKHLTTANSLTNTTLYTFNYDGSGRLDTVVDAYGNTTTVLRNILGVLTGIQAPYGQTTSLSLDTNGYLASIQNPNSETYSMTYYTGGLLHTFQKPRGQTSTMTYDSEGNLTQDSNSAGNVLDFLLSLDFHGNRTINMTTAEGRTTSHVITYSGTDYDRTTTSASGTSSNFHNYPNTQISTTTNGSISEMTNLTDDGRFSTALKIPSNYVNSIPGVGYKVISYAQTVANTASTPTAFNYDTIQLDANQNSQTTSSLFTRTTGETVTTSPEGRLGSQTQDAYGKTTNTQWASFQPVVYAYDVHGRLSTITQGSRVTTYTYDSSGNVATITDPASQTKSYAYDSAGRVLTETLPDTRVITYTYDGNGNVTSITPPSSNTHIFNLNNFDLNSSYVPPALGMSNVTTTYAYNNDKQLTLVTRPDTSTLTYSYGSTSGLLTSITTSTGANSYTLDNLGNITSMLSMDGITTNQSFGGNTVTNFTTYNSSYQNIGTVYFSFNNDFNMTGLTIYGSSGSTAVSFTYDNDGILNSAGDETLDLDADTGFVNGSTLDNIEESFTYDSDYAELASSSASYVPTSGSPTVLFAETITSRDYLGRITAKTESTNGTTNSYTYTYDSVGRLTDAVKNSVVVSHYNFDSNSNRTSGSVAGASFSATYDAQDRVSTFGVFTYTHNLNGEMTQKTDGTNTTNYTYDEFGNLKTVTLPSTTVISYQYDGRNRRVAKLTGSTVNAYWVYQDQTRIAAELDSSGAITKQFIYATKSNVPDYMIAGGNNYRIITDHLGSVRVVVDATTGIVEQRMNYDENGDVITDTNPGFQPFGFAGGLYDGDTGLVHFGAREYDPQTGWMSKDPILFDGGDTNLYGYTWNDPVNWIDSEGLSGTRAMEDEGGGGGWTIPNGIPIIPPFSFPGSDRDSGSSDWSAPMCSTPEGGHTNNKRPSTRGKHEKGDSRRRSDQGGEKGDSGRRPPRNPPPGYKGPWPPK